MEFPLEYYAYEDIPRQRDIFLVSDKDYNDLVMFWRYYIDDPNPRTKHPNNYIHQNYVSVERIEANYLIINFCVDITLRYHSAIVTLPKNKIRYCLQNYNYQKQPILVVDDKWLQETRDRSFSSFCFIDAIGVKKRLLEDGGISQAALKVFYKEINLIAKKNRKYSFLTFGDSVVLKSPFGGNERYLFDYNPEKLIYLASVIRAKFQDILGLKSYAIFTQGHLHDYFLRRPPKSFFRNHFFLGSLGSPFSDIFDIESQVRDQIKKAEGHPPHDVYMEERFFVTLGLNKDNSCETHKTKYESKISFSQDDFYHCLTFDHLLEKCKKLPSEKVRDVIKFRRLWRMKRFVKRFFKRIVVFRKYSRKDLRIIIDSGPQKRVD